MNRAEATALLGVPESATASEVRKAFLARARLLHPDRFAGGSPADIAAATAAMAQLNEANEVMSSTTPSAPPHESSGRTGERPHAPSGDSFGYPVWTDATTACDICGWGPARPVTFHSVTGMILFWRWGTFQATVCRECGLSFYNEHQRSTLLKGWWGLIAPIATVVAFIGNLGSVGAIKKLGAPSGRHPNARTLTPVPLMFRTPWFKRPLSLIATAVAGIIIVAIVSSLVTPSNRQTYQTPSPSVTSIPVPSTLPSAPQASSGPNSGGAGLVGTCWEDVAGTTQVRQVPCGTTEDWIGTLEVQVASACGSDYLTEDNGWSLCLRPT